MMGIRGYRSWQATGLVISAIIFFIGCKAPKERVLALIHEGQPAKLIKALKEPEYGSYKTLIRQKFLDFPECDACIKEVLSDFAKDTALRHKLILRIKKDKEWAMLMLNWMEEKRRFPADMLDAAAGSLPGMTAKVFKDFLSRRMASVKCVSGTDWVAGIIKEIDAYRGVLRDCAGARYALAEQLNSRMCDKFLKSGQAIPKDIITYLMEIFPEEDKTASKAVQGLFQNLWTRTANVDCKSCESIDSLKTCYVWLTRLSAKGNIPMDTNEPAILTCLQGLDTHIAQQDFAKIVSSGVETTQSVLNDVLKGFPRLATYVAPIENRLIIELLAVKNIDSLPGPDAIRKYYSLFQLVDPETYTKALQVIGRKLKSMRIRKCTNVNLSKVTKQMEVVQKELEFLRLVKFVNRDNAFVFADTVKTAVDTIDSAQTNLLAVRSGYDDTKKRYKDAKKSRRGFKRLTVFIVANIGRSATGINYEVAFSWGGRHAVIDSQRVFYTTGWARFCLMDLGIPYFDGTMHEFKAYDEIPCSWIKDVAQKVRTTRRDYYKSRRKLRSAKYKVRKARRTVCHKANAINKKMYLWVLRTLRSQKIAQTSKQL